MYKSVGNNDVKRCANLLAGKAHNIVMQYDMAMMQFRRLLVELEALQAEYAKRLGDMTDEDIAGNSKAQDAATD